MSVALEIIRRKQLFIVIHIPYDAHLDYGWIEQRAQRGERRAYHRRVVRPDISVPHRDIFIGRHVPAAHIIGGPKFTREVRKLLAVSMNDKPLLIRFRMFKKQAPIFSGLARAYIPDLIGDRAPMPFPPAIRAAHDPGACATAYFVRIGCIVECRHRPCRAGRCD